MHSPQAKAMVRTLFLSQQAVSKGLGRPAGLAKSEIRKVSIVGADKICAVLALEQASAGIATVLLTSADAIPAVRKMLHEEAAHLRLSGDKLVQAMERIIVADDPALARASDLVIYHTQSVAMALPPEIVGEAGEVLLISDGQSAAVDKSRKFHAVLNFLAQRMTPVEVMKRDSATDLLLARIVDYVVKLRKTPIVVSDVAGGYVSRVALAYADEGQRMLADGISPIRIENSGVHASMAQGPLAAAGVTPHAGKQRRGDTVSVTEDPYDGAADVDDHKARLLFRQSIEAVRCVEEGVVDDPRIADVGAILGWGFASWTGGPLSYIDMLGVQNFVEHCNALSKKYGSRFSPPQLLLQMDAAGKYFY
jgi:3-hydroxyacyl-CoA dehydrogenase/enoyl-CoA hydratase/3-hydroxybutyryl-CoA epimerase